MTRLRALCLALVVASPAIAQERVVLSAEALSAAQAVSDAMPDDRLRDLAYAGLLAADAATGARDCRIADTAMEQSWLLMSASVAQSLSADAALQQVLLRVARDQVPPVELLSDPAQVTVVEDLVDQVDQLVARSGPLVFGAGYARVDDDAALVLTHACP